MGDHDACDQMLCRASQITDLVYQAKHGNTDCDCGMVKVDALNRIKISEAVKGFRGGMQRSYIPMLVL